MIINMTGGAGGGGLNFKVVQYTSTPTGTAKENTIGVVTSTPISGWVMQAEQPKAAAGLVWIEVAAASAVAFYADKKQLVKIYPVKVKQYVDGAFSNKEAYVYQNGAWVQFSTIMMPLYSNGTKYVDFTEQGTGSITWGDSYVTLNVTTSSTAGEHTRNAYTTDAINVSGYSELTLDYYVEKGTANHDTGIVVGTSTSVAPTMHKQTGVISDCPASASASVKGKNGTSGKLTVNLADVSGDVRIIFGIYNNSNGSTASFTTTVRVTDVTLK